MKKAIESWKELGKIYELEGQWIKRHWKGFTVFMLIYMVVLFVPYWLEYRESKKEIQKLTEQGKIACEKAKDEIRKYHSLTDSEEFKNRWKDSISEC